MAKFVYEEGDYGYVRLEAKVGEEIPTEMVVAWAAIQQSHALNKIADNIIGVDNAITDVGRVISEK